jgi:hypothetical protein
MSWTASAAKFRFLTVIILIYNLNHNFHPEWPPREAGSITQLDKKNYEITVYAICSRDGRGLRSISSSRTHHRRSSKRRTIRQRGAKGSKEQENEFTSPRVFDTMTT